jgi:hypothetical protein
MSFFHQYIGIDYSGAETPISSLKGLRVYMADRDSLPTEVQPPPGSKKYWTRRGIAEWLAEQPQADHGTIVGIDHGFSFPIRYFEVHHLLPDWPSFLDDFQRHWPTDGDHVYVDFIRDGLRGNGADRMGNAHWRRLTEERARSAKSVFHFDVPGSVAKSTHSGIPWLRYLRQKLAGKIHFWPFDGWEFLPGRSVIAEVYPSLWSRGFAREDRNQDQHDAYSVARWLRQADLDGSISTFLTPPLTSAERTLAQVEGWILGVM